MKREILKETKETRNEERERIKEVFGMFGSVFVLGILVGGDLYGRVGKENNKRFE